MSRCIRRVVLGLSTVALAAASPCAASIATVQPSIGAAQITITTPGGDRAVIDRRPFRLRFLDPAGRTVLREVPGPAQPAVIVPTAQLQFGTITPPPSTAYAPLGFLVGVDAVGQLPAGQWEGDLTAVTEGGIDYSAQSVLAAQPRGAGVELTVSTNDPSGRELLVAVTPGHQRDAIDVRVRPSSTDGVAAMADSFASTPAEAFHGFGGRHNSLDQHGEDFVNWLQQENVSSGIASGLTAPVAPGGARYLFPNGPQAAYYVQSSFVSSDGYGFLLRSSTLSRWRLDSDRQDGWQTAAAGTGLDYTVIPGPPTRAIAELTAITGRQPVPPRWAVGSVLDREVKYPSDPPAAYAAEVQADIDHIRRAHVHLDGYRIEGWAELPAPVLAHLITELKDLGIHPLVYFRAFVGQDTTGTDDPLLYDYATGHGYVATTASGSPFTFVSNFNAAAAMIDFSNPAAVRWWQSRITRALDLGADGFMQDFGEQVLSDMHFHDGLTGAAMHNLLPVLYDRATRQAIDAYERRHRGRRIFFFTRAGYSGTPGNAAYENANFPGDETTDFSPAAGLASQTPDMLNRGIGGAYGFTTDIGGYFDLGPFTPTTVELFLRWAEWSALSPLFRVHGSLFAGVHTPWSFGASAERVFARLTALHLAARPLILRLWREADATGVPVARPLWLVSPEDRVAAANDQEWLLGPDVLVAPVTTAGATRVAVTFPPGCWRRVPRGPSYDGPTTATVPAPLDQLPYFFRCRTRPFQPPG